LDLKAFDELQKNKLSDSEELNKIRTIKDLPTPKGQIILGNFMAFRGYTQHRVIEDWANELESDVFKINLAGKKMVVTTSPEFTKKLLKARPDQIARFKSLSSSITSTGIVGLVNVEGKHGRGTDSLCLKL